MKGTNLYFNPDPRLASATPREKAKRILASLDPNTWESRSRQTIGKAVRIDERHRVEWMQKPERRAVDAVHAGEHTARTQDASNLAEGPAAPPMARDAAS